MQCVKLAHLLLQGLGNLQVLAVSLLYRFGHLVEGTGERAQLSEPDSQAAARFEVAAGQTATGRNHGAEATYEEEVSEHGGEDDRDDGHADQEITPRRRLASASL